jgi:hypothetical protein
LLLHSWIFGQNGKNCVTHALVLFGIYKSFILQNKDYSKDCFVRKQNFLEKNALNVKIESFWIKNCMPKEITIS